MISLAPGTKVFLACQPIDLRAGFNGLAAKAQQVIGQNPFDGSLFIFRGKRGDYFKAIYWDGSGLWLLAKRLEKGRFVWPPIVEGAMTLTPAQLAVPIEAMDRRRRADQCWYDKAPIRILLWLTRIWLNILLACRSPPPNCPPIWSRCAPSPWPARAS